MKTLPPLALSLVLVVEGLAPEFYIKALTQICDILPSGVELNLIPFEDAFESLKEKSLRKTELEAFKKAKKKYPDKIWFFLCRGAQGRY